MGPLPKRRYAKARAGERRAHIGLTPPPMDSCPQCHSPKLAHHVCPTCGYYNGKEEIKVESPKKKST